MTKIKAFFDWIMANKRSLTGTVTGAAASAVGITAAWTIQALPDIEAGGINIAPFLYTAVCLVCFLLNEMGITGRGFESVVTYMAQKQNIVLKKQQTEIEKAAAKELEDRKKAEAAAEIEAKKQIEAAAFREKVEAKKMELLQR